MGTATKAEILAEIEKQQEKLGKFINSLDTIDDFKQQKEKIIQEIDVLINKSILLRNGGNKKFFLVDDVCFLLGMWYTQEKQRLLGKPHSLGMLKELIKDLICPALMSLEKYVDDEVKEREKINKKNTEKNK